MNLAWHKVTIMENSVRFQLILMKVNLEIYSAYLDLSEKGNCVTANMAQIQID